MGGKQHVLPAVFWLRQGEVFVPAMQQVDMFTLHTMELPLRQREKGERQGGREKRERM